MNSNKGKRWSNEELKLLRKGLSLDKLENLLGRTKDAIFYKSFDLKKKDSARWGAIYSLYEEQFYEANRARLIKYQKDYYKNHRREMIKIFKEHYRTKVRNKPYKRQGAELEKRINLSYKERDNPILDFVYDLVDLKVIKSTATPYHWIEGYRRPHKSILHRLSKILKVSEIKLENLLYPN